MECKMDRRTSASNSFLTLCSSSALMTRCDSSRSSMMKLCFSFMKSKICFTAESLAEGHDRAAVIEGATHHVRRTPWSRVGQVVSIGQKDRHAFDGLHCWKRTRLRKA